MRFVFDYSTCLCQRQPTKRRTLHKLQRQASSLWTSHKLNDVERRLFYRESCGKVGQCLTQYCNCTMSSAFRCLWAFISLRGEREMFSGNETFIKNGILGWIVEHNFQLIIQSAPKEFRNHKFEELLRRFVTINSVNMAGVVVVWPVVVVRVVMVSFKD